MVDFSMVVKAFCLTVVAMAAIVFLLAFLVAYPIYFFISLIFLIVAGSIFVQILWELSEEDD